MEELTERQQQVLGFILRHIAEHRYPPTVREIGAALDIRSTNGVSDHLKALERKGYLGREGMKSRALTPTPAAWEALGIEQVGETRDSSPPKAANDDSLEIPLLGRVAAGAPILAEESWDSSIRVDPSWGARAKGSRLFALAVRGDSMMEDGIFDGDTVIVRHQNTASRGDLVVAMIDGEATVKRYFPEGKRIRLQPANSAMEPIYVHADEARDTAIVGLVVGLFRSYPS